MPHSSPPPPKTPRSTSSVSAPRPSRANKTAAAKFQGVIFAGTSGWAYPTWKPGFYPADVPAKRFLEHYASRLNSVEVNYTFRKLPTASMLDGWLAATPAGFRFSFKAPQRITHFRRLRDCNESVAELVAAVQPVREAGKLGPLLFQLPPNFKADSDRLTAFLAAPALKTADAPLIAFEFRHESWFTEEIYGILRERDAALCIAENEDLQTPAVQCAQTHACYRLRASGGYSATKIAAFAKSLSEVAATRDVYVYFKHEEEPTGALNAVAFLKAYAEGAGKR